MRLIGLFLFISTAHSKTNGGKYLFSIEREVAIHHPRIICWFFAQDLFDWFSLVFAKIKDLYPIVVKYYTTCIIDIAIVFGEFRKKGNATAAADEIVSQVYTNLKQSFAEWEDYYQL